jgi:hypothetical protein
MEYLDSYNDKFEFTVSRVLEDLPSPQCCHVFRAARCHTSDTQKEKGGERQRRHGGLERSIPLGGAGAMGVRQCDVTSTVSSLRTSFFPAAP